MPPLLSLRRLEGLLVAEQTGAAVTFPVVDRPAAFLQGQALVVADYFRTGNAEQLLLGPHGRRQAHLDVGNAD